MRNNHLCDTGRWFFRLSALDGALLLRRRGPRRVHSSEKKFREESPFWAKIAFPPPACVVPFNAYTSSFVEPSGDFASPGVSFGRGAHIFCVRSSEERVRHGQKCAPHFLPKKSAERGCARLETTSSFWEKHSEISQCGRAGLERSLEWS